MGKGCAVAVLGGVVVAGAAIIGVTRVMETAVSTMPSEAGQAWFTAARRGDVGALRAALAQGVAIDLHEPHHGRTALMRAAHFGHLEAVEMLLAAGASTSAVDLEDATALYLAASVGEAGVVTRLARAGADVNVRKAPDAVTPLFAALAGRHLAAAEALLDAGADPSRGSQDLSPLERAIDDADAGAVVALLRAGAKPVPSGLAHGRDGLLARAVDQCQDTDPRIIAALAAAGADGGAVDGQGKTAFEWATYFAGRRSERQACSRRQLEALVAAGVTR